MSQKSIKIWTFVSFLTHFLQLVMAFDYEEWPSKDKIVTENCEKSGF